MLDKSNLITSDSFRELKELLLGIDALSSLSSIPAAAVQALSQKALESVDEIELEFNTRIEMRSDLNRNRILPAAHEDELEYDFEDLARRDTTNTNGNSESRDIQKRMSRNSPSSKKAPVSREVQLQPETVNRFFGGVQILDEERA